MLQVRIYYVKFVHALEFPTWHHACRPCIHIVPRRPRYALRKARRTPRGLGEVQDPQHGRFLVSELTSRWNRSCNRSCLGAHFAYNHGRIDGRWCAATAAIKSGPLGASEAIVRTRNNKSYFERCFSSSPRGLRNYALSPEASLWIS